MLLVLALACACVISSSCATRRGRTQQDFGIPACSDQAGRDLLSSSALQCWFTAPHGRWRTLNHQSHLEALVVDVEARDLRDAVDIARRITEDSRSRAFSEILVYARERAEARPDGRELRIRRVRWTAGTGFETLDFSAPAGDAPLTVRSR
jgi:hypothetical protein